MAYYYDPSEEERGAAALLREKGWTVNEPQCPKCHGSGSVYKFDTWSGGGSTSATPCPDGCPSRLFFYNSASSTRTVVADGTVGMRRGE